MYWVRIRVLPLAVDLAEWISIRIGGDVGLQWLPAHLGREGYVEWMPALSGEVVLRFLGGDIEVGAFGGIQFTGVSPRAARSFYPVEQYVLGSQVAVLF